MARRALGGLCVAAPVRGLLLFGGTPCLAPLSNDGRGWLCVDLFQRFRFVPVRRPLRLEPNVNWHPAGFEPA